MPSQQAHLIQDGIQLNTLALLNLNFQELGIVDHLLSYYSIFVENKLINSKRPNGTAGESAQFDNLWLASLISSVFPVISLILVNFLIPDVRQTESIGVEGEVNTINKENDENIELDDDDDNIELDDEMNTHVNESEGSVVDKKLLSLSNDLTELSDMSQH